MSGRIIQLPADRHREVLSLLPWYLAGGLDEAESARVEAHLNQCAECQAEARSERRLAEEIGGLPVGEGMADVEHGWKLIRRRIEREERKRSPFAAWSERLFGRRSVSTGPRRAEAPWLRWAVAVQFCLLLIMSFAVWRTNQPARYHALGAAPVNAAGNVIVIFRPETPEKDLREILRANDARLVDGPTVADAYLLHVPAGGRAAVLARLQRQAQVVLAEPIDAR